MVDTLHFETVTPRLREVLEDMMSERMFAPFGLAGGTSLSLRLGHRMSIDMDLLTNARYASLDFKRYEGYLSSRFPYFDCIDSTGITSFGKTYYVGESEHDNVKVDMFYHDDIADPYETIDGIRLLTLDDVAAMKTDVVARKGRKKDFWDLHELLNHYSIDQLLDLHLQRHEWDHDRDSILNNFTDFTLADQMFDPVCLREKSWGLIMDDFIELLATIK
jgi:Domain of unknown function (DUF1814).